MRNADDTDRFDERGQQKKRRQSVPDQLISLVIIAIRVICVPFNRISYEQQP